MVVQARPDIRVRVRSIVVRIRVRHPSIRVRVVVAAIDHTGYWETPPLQNYRITVQNMKEY